MTSAQPSTNQPNTHTNAHVLTHNTHTHRLHGGRVQQGRQGVEDLGQPLLHVAVGELRAQSVVRELLDLFAELGELRVGWLAARLGLGHKPGVEVKDLLEVVGGLVRLLSARFRRRHPRSASAAGERGVVGNILRTTRRRSSSWCRRRSWRSSSATTTAATTVRHGELDAREAIGDARQQCQQLRLVGHGCC